ncbi:mechanosensitive ion channel family protein [Conexibacter woesei]|uniref:MscS Mechanosensitive ion channel n=1 Tax=Conexibacter woesei (strain DSM 14684 / CCUG 47730 / CIP 108061 / JCM 11494 / NBRC 100937 / ID131577) TaxID=469383 RepID=D3FE54_CONWI|nr:mechanosensitive ion channel family protein [Conexibacter woesei]ADB51670.1 MscS Mechanosensitive ion channel [Conexibacter woesei DSM 14684]
MASKKTKRLKGSRERALERMLQTRTHAWEEVGLARQLGTRAAKRARRQALILLPLLAGVLALYRYREDLFGHGWNTPVRIFTVVALVVLGWAFARDVGRAVAPDLFRRMDPGTAGTVGFLLRLLTIAIFTVAALRIAGIRPETLAVGGAFTAVVVGLAAQQTLGNLIAGTVLLSARPFRVGERVRLQAGGIAGTVEGVVSSLGLLYTTLARGEDRIMVPNSVVLSAAVVPLKEPAAVDLRARLQLGVKPTQVQELLKEAITVSLRGRPDIGLEEIDGDDVVMRIQATPEYSDDGAKLADEILMAMSSIADEHAVAR